MLIKNYKAQIMHVFISMVLLFSLQSHVEANTDTSATNSAKKDVHELMNIQLLQKKAGVGAAAVIIEGDKTAFITLGVMDKQSQQKITPDTLFEIGSISKTFTSLALAYLHEQKQVKLTDTIEQYLPINSPDAVGIAKNDITLLSLANHTSGLPRMPSNFQPANINNPYQDYDEKLLFEYLSNAQLTKKVGQSIEYSNVGVGLLGTLLAKKKQISYEQLIQQAITQPLDMQHTFVNVPKKFQSQVATGYGDTLTAVSGWDLAALSGAGGLTSSLADMAKYLQAQMKAGQVVNEKLGDAITLSQQQTFKINAQTNIGLGWFMNTYEGQTYYFHNGATGGYSSFMAFSPQKNKGIVLLTNSTFNMDDIGFAYIQNTTQAALLNVKKSLLISPTDLAKLKGVYGIMPNFAATITHDDNHLYIQATNQPTFILETVSATEFINKTLQLKIVFNVNQQGIADSLTLYQGGQVLVGKKQ